MEEEAEEEQASAEPAPEVSLLWPQIFLSVSLTGSLAFSYALGFVYLDSYRPGFDQTF